MKRNWTREERKRRLARRVLAGIFAVAMVLAAVSALILPAGGAEASTYLPDAPEDIFQREEEAGTTVTCIPAWEEALDEAEIQENYENELIEAALLERACVIERCRITYYCVERYPHICGTGDGITASGTEVLAGVSCAVDPSMIPLGSDVLIDFGDGDLRYFVADDTGPTGGHIDLAVSTHKEAELLGVTQATVYWVEQPG